MRTRPSPSAGASAAPSSGCPAGARPRSPAQVWNARLIYNTPDDKWTVVGWVNNVFDEEYLQYSFDFTNSFGLNQLGYGSPQWAGVTVGFKW